jgi:hypothetical protein
MLLGTSDPDRAAVTLHMDQRHRLIGYVRLSGSEWVVEGDPANRRFETPREAAEWGRAYLWPIK